MSLQKYDGTLVTPELARRYAQASGGREVPAEVQNRQAPHFRQIKGFPVSRIVPEDDPLLSFFRWYWYDGDRWNSYSTDATRIYQDRQHPMATMYDPIVRNPPIRGSGGKVTFGSQWVYVVPEPYNCSFSISEEQAMVKGHPGQGVWAMIQAITYRRECAPGAPPEGATAPAWYGKYPDCRYVSTPSDFMREAMWCLFSRQIDGHCHYAFQALIPQPDPIDKKTGKSTRTPYTYVCTDTNTYYVISELFHRIGEPLGPLLRAAPERPPQVAVLESFATYAFAHKASMSSTCQPIFDRGSIAVVASLQPYVLYEEDLAEKGIPDSVKVLLAPHCDVLAQKSFEAIRAWQLKGGVLIADANLPPALMRDYDYPPFARTGKAATDAPAVRKAAAELRALVSKACVPYAGTSTDDIFTWVRSSGSADYVFAINDRRVAGDYVGQWGVIHEKGLPTSGSVTIERASGAVYDLERHCAVPFASEGGRTTVQVDLKPCDGAVLMATAAPLKPLKVIESETSVGCMVTVYASENPLWNETFKLSTYIGDEKSGYPKYTSDYLSTHAMPRSWDGANGLFVDEQMTQSNLVSYVENSGIAWQMQGKGKGSVSYTRGDGPSGLDEVLGRVRDLIVDLGTQPIRVVADAVPEGDAHGDGAYVQILLADHLDGFQYISCIQHESLRLLTPGHTWCMA